MTGNWDWNKYKNLWNFLQKKKKKHIPLQCLRVTAVLHSTLINEHSIHSSFPCKFFTVAYTTMIL